MSTAVLNRSPNKLWRLIFIFNLAKGERNIEKSARITKGKALDFDIRDKNCKFLSGSYTEEKGTRADCHKQLMSTAGWSKTDFAERDKCNPVLLRLSLAGNLCWNF
jgi:hypothetical protein